MRRCALALTASGLGLWVLLLGGCGSPSGPQQMTTADLQGVWHGASMQVHMTSASVDTTMEILQPGSYLTMTVGPPAANGRANYAADYRYSSSGPGQHQDGSMWAAADSVYMTSTSPTPTAFKCGWNGGNTMVLTSIYRDGSLTETSQTTFVR